VAQDDQDLVLTVHTVHGPGDRGNHVLLGKIHETVEDMKTSGPGKYIAVSNYSWRDELIVLISARLQQKHAPNTQWGGFHSEFLLPAP
jgi:hypothetical protein